MRNRVSERGNYVGGDMRDLVTLLMVLGLMMLATLVVLVLKNVI